MNSGQGSDLDPLIYGIRLGTRVHAIRGGGVGTRVGAGGVGFGRPPLFPTKLDGGRDIFLIDFLFLYRHILKLVTP